MSPLLRVILLACLMLALPAQAERYQSFGRYQVHYNAFPSTMLEPQIAKETGVTRSRMRGAVLISVQKDGEPVPAIVQVHAQNLEGQYKSVELRQIRRGDAYSYLGTFRVEHQETVRFRIEASPVGASQVLHAGFSQQFFSDHRQ